MTYILSQLPLTKLENKTKEELYTTDWFYFIPAFVVWNTKLYSVFENSYRISSMPKVKQFDEIKDWDTEFIKVGNRIFGENDIKQVIDLFVENNFRRNPICECILG